MDNNYRPTTWSDFPSEEACLEALEKLPTWHPDRSIYEQTYYDRFAHEAERAARNGDMIGYREHKADYVKWHKKRAERLNKR